MKHTLPSETIEKAKREIEYMWDDKGFHQHDDCVRIAFEWLSAQKRTKTISGHFSHKHDMERWAGRYVCSHDVELAAHILGIPVKNGRMGISKNTVLPCFSRLDLIEQVNIHVYLPSLDSYRRFEERPGVTKPISQLHEDVKAYFMTPGKDRDISQ